MKQRAFFGFFTSRVILMSRDNELLRSHAARSLPGFITYNHKIFFVGGGGRGAEGLGDRLSG